MSVQSLVLSSVNVRAMLTRATSSFIAILGFAGVSTMLVVLLSGREALQAMYDLAGRDDIAVVRAGDATYEGESVIPPGIALEIERMPGIEHNDNGAPVSKELVRGARLLPEDSDRLGVSLPFRGVTDRAFEVHPQLRILTGRRFASGKYEVIAGRGIAEQYRVHIGSKVRVQRATLLVVGIFSSGVGSAEMEIWGDKGVFESLGRPAGVDRGNTPAMEQISTLWVKLAGPGGLQALQGEIAGSKLPSMKALHIRAASERQFLQAQSNDLIASASKAAVAVGLVMGIGALFGAINSMYAAVASRSREIATLRAIGFRSLPVAVSVIVEALLLASAGGLIGVGVALLATHDMAFTIFNSGASINLAVHFMPTSATILVALGYVLLLGAFSSILPCTRALRCPIPVGLFAR